VIWIKSAHAMMSDVSTQHALPAAATDIDPYCDEFLANPYPFHELLREAGPVVWLARYGIWSMARFAEVDAALRDWKAFCSSAGVGISDFRKEKPWRVPSLVLEADPPLHTRTRAVLARTMSPGAASKMRESFAREAEELVEQLVERGRFDAVRDLAEIYPLKVFPDALGLPPGGRDNLLTYGRMTFNGFGPRNALFENSLANAQPVLGWIGSQCRREALSADGMGAVVYAAVDSGELTPEEAALLVRSFLSAGIDTTVTGLGNALYCLATHPEQWRALSSDPSLARGAFEETLRFESPVQTFFRTTTSATEISGRRLGEGEKVLLFLASANRDPRRWNDPERYDIRRKVAGHVGFGAGIHGCVGQMVARLEGELVLSTLARRVDRLELAGEPKRRLNNTLRGLASLPLRVSRKRR
jgi:4-methoxybenzoate monooxygenase (O-demethylating)